MVDRVLGVSLVTLTIFSIGSVMTFERYYADRIYPGVSIWGVEIGGMDREEAVAVLKDEPRLDESLITLRGSDRSWHPSPNDLGLQLRPHATLTHAYRRGRRDPWIVSLPSHLRLLAFGVDLPPVILYDPSKARRYLEAVAERVDVAPTDAKLSFEGITPKTQPGRSGRRLDVEATLVALSPVITRLAPAEIDLVTHDIQPTVTDAEPARARAEALLSSPLKLVLPNPQEGDPGPWVIPPERLVAVLEVRVREGTLGLALDEEPLRAQLQDLTPALAVDPVNARFSFDEATGQLESIRASRKGRALDVEASVDRIVRALQAGEHRVPLVVRAIPPRFPDTATAEGLGIVELVSEGKSYFIGSPSGRDHNIRLAARRFDGLVIPPGETFSFNRHLGEVTAEAGYDESYITAGEQLEMGIGGGICQVSTTAFRAAFWGGYPITERWPHYQRVGYYELLGSEVGMDATVYSPHIDLKFTNDRSASLLIETEVEESGHRLIFRFYSVDDGRRVEKEGPVIKDEIEPGPPIYQLDRGLAAGTVTKWQSEVGGLTAAIERWVYDAAGEVLHHDIFVSEYVPRRAAYHYGPGYEPPEGEAEP